MADSSLFSLQTVSIIVLCAIILIFVNIAITILLYRKLIKYRKGYSKLALKFNNETIEEDLKYIIDHINESNKLNQNVQQNINQLEEMSKRCVQKIGLVRYDAYGSGNNLLSFSLAILDKNDNGVLLNSVHGRDYSNIYVKEVKLGETMGNISQEESEALRKAINKKDFM